MDKSTEPQDAIVLQQNRRGARLTMATTEAPQYVLQIRDLAGGRRLLSDDLAMLARAALVTTRRSMPFVLSRRAIPPRRTGAGDTQARRRGRTPCLARPDQPALSI